MFKTITVISGKGGTGKTTFSATLADGLDTVNLIDADINAPNLSLIIPNEKKNEIQTKTGNQVAVIGNQCNGCKICTEVCRFEAISMNNQNYATVDPGLCIGCEVCSYNCPVDTIYMKSREFTNISVGKWAKGYILFPNPKPGEPISSGCICLTSTTPSWVMISTAAAVDLSGSLFTPHPSLLTIPFPATA